MIENLLAPKCQTGSYMPLIPSELTDSNRANNLLCHARCFLLVVGTCFFGCSQSQKTNERFSTTSIDSRPDHVNYDVTEAQALLFATNLEESIKGCDTVRSDELVNMSVISDIAFREVDYPEQVKQIYFDAASRQSLMGSVMSQVRNAGTYHFLRLRKVGGAYHPLFRLVHRDGAFAYHEFELMLDSDGQPIASDFYSTFLGRWMQEDITSTLVSDLQLRGDKVEASETAQLLLTHKATLDGMLYAIKSNEMLTEALLEFRNLPRELQADRRFLIMATHIAGRISEAELAVEAARFKKHISDESMLDHILVGLMIQQADTEQALQIIQRIDERIGGDKFLDLPRANAYLASNRVDDASKSIERVGLALPGIYAIYRTRAVIACRNHDFKQVTKILREIETQFGQAIARDSFIDDQEFANYIESSEYATLSESIETSR